MGITTNQLRMTLESDADAAGRGMNNGCSPQREVTLNPYLLTEIELLPTSL